MTGRERLIVELARLEDPMMSLAARIARGEFGPDADPYGREAILTDTSCDIMNNRPRLT